MQPGQGGNAVLLFSRPSCIKCMKTEWRGHCCSAVKQKTEVVTEPNQCVCKVGSWQDGTEVVTF